MSGWLDDVDFKSFVIQVLVGRYRSVFIINFWHVAITLVTLMALFMTYIKFSQKQLDDYHVKKNKIGQALGIGEKDMSQRMYRVMIG